MTDKPILFQPAMVQSLLAGTKTQTRRALKMPTKTFSGGSIYERPDMGGWEPCTHGGGGCFTIARNGDRIPALEMVGMWHKTTGMAFCTPLQIGDRLWVRESWRSVIGYDGRPPRDIPEGTPIYYDADGSMDPGWKWGRKRPSMFMPRWASRITLTVTDVRVMRLHNISEADVWAEGTPIFPGPPKYAQHEYARLWNGINGHGAWEANPYVAAYTFTVHRGNIDEVKP
jgi:hypothetical protein